MTVSLAPDDVVRTHAEAAANAREPLIVLEPLTRLLEAHDLEVSEDLTATPIGDGHSNVTFALSTGVVLRRPPRGPLPPSAHDVLREARLLRALESTGVRVPRLLVVCDDPTVIGAPFYVMERVTGEVITDAIPAGLDNAEQRSRIADELVDALVELHGIDWTRIDLEGFGKPTGYLERQLRRFSGLWEHNRTRELPQVEEVGRWLASNLPQSPQATIVHGDFRLGQHDVRRRRAGPTGGDLRLGDGHDRRSARRRRLLAHALDAARRRARQVQPEQRDLAARLPDAGAELTSRYEARSGRPVQALDWYVTLALWKAIVFMEGNYKRAMAGSTDDPYLKSFGDGVVEIADRALAVSRYGLKTADTRGCWSTGAAC